MVIKMFDRTRSGFISGVSGLLAVLISLVFSLDKLSIIHNVIISLPPAIIMLPLVLGLIALFTGKYSQGKDNANSKSRFFGAIGLIVGIIYLLLTLFLLSFAGL